MQPVHFSRALSACAESIACVFIHGFQQLALSNQPPVAALHQKMPHKFACHSK
jgi:hypothetical protein